jgi:serine/threonine protein kinase
VNFKGYSCIFEEPETITLMGSKNFLIQDDYHKGFILKVYSYNPESTHELDLLLKYKKDPYVVQVVNYKIMKNTVLMILDCGNRTTFDKLILNTSSFTNRAYFYKIAKNLLQGVIDLNKNGISLTRIYPQDIILDKDNLPIFTNFEYAHEYSPARPLKGGSNLLAPELIDVFFSAKPYLPKPSGDIYSFGILLYYMRYKKFPYDELQKSTFNALHQMIQFPISEEMDFIDLIRLILVDESKRGDFDHIKSKILNNQLTKNMELTRQRTKFQVNDGRLIAYENENEKQKIIVLSIGTFVFVLFVVSLIYIKCKKCFKKENYDYEVGIITNE